MLSWLQNQSIKLAETQLFKTSTSCEERQQHLDVATPCKVSQLKSLNVCVCVGVQRCIKVFLVLYYRASAHHPSLFIFPSHALVPTSYPPLMRYALSLVGGMFEKRFPLKHISHHWYKSCKKRTLTEFWTLHTCHSLWETNWKIPC